MSDIHRPQPNPDTVAYGFALPAQAPPEALRALEGVANAFGIEITPVGEASQQAEAYNPPVHLEPGDFAVTSLRLWGSEQYAALVPELISDEYTLPLGVEYYGNDKYGDTHRYESASGLIGRLTSSEPLPPAVLEAWIRDRWDSEVVPFELACSWREPQPGIRVPDIRLGALSMGRLAQWVRRRKYEEHCLHGMLGKTLDVVTVTAGVVDADAIEPSAREVESEFIPYTTLLDRLATSNLTPHYKTAIPHAIETAIKFQLKHGRPDGNEVVVEGGLVLTDYRSRDKRPFSVEKIAIGSIHGLADRFKDRQKVEPFLRDF